MNPKPRHVLSNGLLVVVLLALGVGVFVLGQQVVGRRSSETSASSALQATQFAPTALRGIPTEVLPPQTPKPHETGIPTPWPTVVLPIMTPVPTGVNHLEKPTPGQPAEQPTPNPNEPYNLTIIGDGGGDLQIALRDAQTTIIGKVKRVLPAQWDTPDGKRPLNPWAPDNKYTIFTPVLIAVEQHLKGQPTAGEVLLYALGGTVGQDSVNWSADDFYTFHEGEQVVIFLAGSNKGLNGSPLWNIVARYTITADGQAINHYGSMPLQQLVSTIRAAEKQ